MAVTWDEFVKLDPGFQKRIIFDDQGKMIIDLLENGIIEIHNFEVDEEEKMVRFWGTLVQDEQELPVQGWIRPPLDNVEGWTTSDELQFDFWVE